MTRTTPPPPVKTDRQWCAQHGPTAVRMFDQLHVRDGYTTREAAALVGWVVYQAELKHVQPVFDAQAAIASLTQRRRA
jgi:hypothetical protein